MDVTDRPIIFSAPMVRALLAGRKTQTRRLATSPLRRCAPGDRLWVRETWACAGDDPDVAAAYHADESCAPGLRWRPSFHLPRWASRITLTVTDVRVQRVQEISCVDAIAEGIPPAANSATIDCETPDPRDAFRELWSSLHGADSWEANPEVVAITFRVELRNIDQVPA